MLSPIDYRLVLAQAASVVGLGVILGAVRVRTGSIWPGIIVHAVLDFCGIASGGGAGWVLGPAVGAAVTVVLPELLSGLAEYRLLFFGGLLLVVLASMAAGRPFTLQYARDQVAPEFWDQPEFIRTNYVITGAWALAFAVMVLAELALLYMPGLPPHAGVVAIILALVGAVKFTGWYPQREERRTAG